ncbi:hypothetical protein Gorai_023126, partial [Gossypium raimondii]|nr:hypothetical protein [Gossypium raimondii]
EFDSTYGPAWHCIVGTSFGSYVTHSLGGFLYFSIDKTFCDPLAFLGNCIFRELFKMSEEEFGLPSDGLITLLCDSVVMNYIVSLVKRGLAKDIERA